MPRRKHARRFEPRAGVSESMLNAESLDVGRELQDYLLCSLADLRERLTERQTGIVTAEANLRFMIERLPDRERLAVRCMMTRDFLHIAALYERFVRRPEVADATGPCTPVKEDVDQDDEPVAVIPFNEWLFEPPPRST